MTMEAEASVSTGGDDGDDEHEPEAHEKDDHRRALEDSEHKVGYTDVLSDFLQSYRLYLFGLVVLAVLASWRLGVPRWVLISGVVYVVTLAVSWSPVISYVSKFDDGADNFVLEVSPEDSAETHCYAAGDGALVKMDSRNDVPAYPQRGVSAVFEVEQFEPETYTYAGTLRAQLPYAEYVDVEHVRQYGRETLAPLANKVPDLRAKVSALLLSGGLENAVSMVETIEDGLNGDLDLGNEDEEETEDFKRHARELEEQRKEVDDD